MQSIDSVETYPYGMSRELIWKTEKTKNKYNKEMEKCLVLITFQRKT